MDDRRNCQTSTATPAEPGGPLLEVRLAATTTRVEARRKLVMKAPPPRNAPTLPATRCDLVNEHAEPRLDAFRCARSRMRQGGRSHPDGGYAFGRG
jgi:hypothetical protein